MSNIFIITASVVYAEMYIDTMQVCSIIHRPAGSVTVKFAVRHIYIIYNSLFHSMLLDILFFEFKFNIDTISH